MYLNQITIIGNATRDAETKVTSKGKKKNTFAVAVNAGQDKVDFFEVLSLDKDYVEKIKKGDSVMVQGAMRSNKSESGTVYWSLMANKVLVLNAKTKKTKKNEPEYYCENEPEY